MRAFLSTFTIGLALAVAMDDRLAGWPRGLCIGVAVVSLDARYAKAKGAA